MAEPEFRSNNPLGLLPPELMQAMPTQVWGADPGDPTTPILVATPISDGGVMCVGSSDLLEASRWNWKHGYIGFTDMGAVIDMEFVIIDPPSSFAQSVSTSTGHFGSTTVTTGAAGTGDDFSGGDPHREIGPFYINNNPDDNRIVIGTSTQRLIATGANSTQNVYITLELLMHWVGLRWWDSAETGDSFVGGFSTKLSGIVEPENGYEWEEAQNFQERSSALYSNWKVFEIEELSAWQLPTIPIGGPSEVWNGGQSTLADIGTIALVFGDDAFPADTIPFRSYDFGTPGAGASVSIKINSWEVRFPSVLGSIPAL